MFDCKSNSFIESLVQIQPFPKKIIIMYFNYLKKAFVKNKIKSNGRNNKGIITSRRRGGGNRTKKRYILYNFKDRSQTNFFVYKNIYNKITKSNLFLIGDEKNFFLIKNIDNVEIKKNYKNNFTSPGSVFKLKDVPNGTFVNNIELRKSSGSKLIRADGCYGILVSKDQKKIKVKLPSGKFISLVNDCLCLIGKLTFTKNNINKAGINRRIGFRPKVRGVAINPVDHPHGGGEGKSSGGRISVSPWGKLSKFKKKK